MRKRRSVKIIPLGGLGEIGKNITAIEYENEIIVTQSTASDWAEGGSIG